MQPRITCLIVALFLAIRVSAAPETSLPEGARAKIHPGLLNTGGDVTAVVRLTEPPLLARLGRDAKTRGLSMTRDEQIAYVRGLRAGQEELVRRTLDAGGTVEGVLFKALNAVVVRVPSDRLPDLAGLPAVATIRPLGSYRLDLSETLPYVGATAVHQAGVTGEGIRVAVLDSGIDYTHRNLGGPGTVAAYEAAYGSGPTDSANRTRDGLFPTTKVIGGWDFVGEGWPATPEVFDEDPIDYEGHGTHVADILAGASVDGLHQGVAPGARLYAFKVCSALETACSGLAILYGLEACLSPDSPVDVEYIDNPVDIINLSVGAPYGQIQDDASYMVELICRFGITVVTSGGNTEDRPYSAGAPGIAPGAISVAQTQVPGAKAYSVRVFRNSNKPTSEIINTADIEWAPVNRTVNGPLLYVGRGCPGDTYLVRESSVRKAVVLVDRGGCDVSSKIDRAARLGALGVILVNNEPGDPPTFSQGEGSLFIPTLVVSQADGEALKASLPGAKVKVTFGPRLFRSLAGSMVATSGRGPSYSFQTIKPDMGAPGASVSAVSGSGTGQAAFGGTSGAAPMVAGAAALLQSHYLSTYGFVLSGYEIRAMLMNHAETNILTSPVAQPGVPAPITRIGAGELRAGRALASRAAALTLGEPFDGEPDFQSSLSFGYRSLILPGPVSITRKIHVFSYTDEPLVFAVSSSFRYANDAALGAVSLTFSSPTVSVEPWDVGTVDVTLTVDPSRLAAWQMNGGTGGGDGAALQAQEIDGYVTLSDGVEALHLPWHLLPRKASDQAVGANSVRLTAGAGTLALSNLRGAAATGTSEVFLLGGVSRQDYPKPDPFGGNEAFPDLRAAGVRAVGSNLEFAVVTHEERSYPGYPAEFDVYLDVNNDGIEDYSIYNSITDGNVMANVYRFADGQVLASVPADVDFNSSSLILRVPLATLGLTASSTVRWYLVSYDNYFTGAYTDFIYNPSGLYLRHKLNQPKYAIAGTPSPTLASGTSTTLNISAIVGGTAASPSQTGFLLLHRNAQPGRWADVIQVTAP